MRKKYLAIGVGLYAVVLLVLAPLGNVVGYQTVQFPHQRILNNKVDKNHLSNAPHLFFKQYRVFGTGDGWWINVFNATWIIYLYKGYEGNDSYTNHTRGLYYNTNIYFVNHGGMQINLFCIFIKDRIARITYNKTELPERFIIYHYTGFIDLMHYDRPHGPQGCFFTLIGNAEDFQEYTP